MRTKSVFGVVVAIAMTFVVMAVSNIASAQAQRFGSEYLIGSQSTMPVYTHEISAVGTSGAVDINFRKNLDARNLTAINASVAAHAAIPAYYGTTSTEITNGFNGVFGNGISTFVRLDLGTGVYDRMTATLSVDSTYLLVRGFLLEGVMVDGNSKATGPIPTPSVHRTGREVGMMLLSWTGTTWKVLMFAPEWCMNFSKLSYGKITVYKPNTVVIPGLPGPPNPNPNPNPVVDTNLYRHRNGPLYIEHIDTVWSRVGVDVEFACVDQYGNVVNRELIKEKMVGTRQWKQYVAKTYCDTCQTVKPTKPDCPDCPEPEKWCWGGHLTLGVNAHLNNQSLTETLIDSVGYSLYGNVTATNTGASFGFSLASNLPTNYQIRITYGNGSTVQTYVVNSSQLNGFQINSYGNVKVEIPDLGYSRIFTPNDLGQFDDEFFEYSETKETRDESVYHIMPELGYLWSYYNTHSKGGIVFGGGLYADLPTVRLEDNFRIGPYLAFGAQLPSEKGRKKHLLLKYYFSVDEWGRSTDVEFFNSMLLLEYGGVVNFKVGLVNYDEGSTISLGIGLRL